MTPPEKKKPAQVTVYLSTPCAVAICRHPYNWHTSDGCQAGADGETPCPCIAFATPAP